MRSIHQLLWRCLIDRLNSLHVGCLDFEPAWPAHAPRPMEVLYRTCSFIGSALFYDADSRLPRLSGLGFVLSHQFGIRRTGECFDVRRSPRIMTVRRRSTAPRPPRRVVRGPWTARWFRTSSAQKRRARRRGNNAQPRAFTGNIIPSGPLDVPVATHRTTFETPLCSTTCHISQSTKSNVDGIYLLWIHKIGSSKLLGDYENDVI